MNDRLSSLGPALSPPDSLTKRWQFYSARYGALHAALRYVATRFHSIWPVIGRWATRGYMQRWREMKDAKVLNLGGGGNCLTGCLTADIDPRADVYLNLLYPLPFADQEIDYIFCEEAIEHIDKAAALQLVRECYRVLKPNGSLRISTPDVNWMMESLTKDEISCDDFNDTFYGHGHRFLYTRQELTALLHGAGFSSVRLSRFQDPSSVLGILDSHPLRFRHPPKLSQYQEAIKSP